MSKKKAIRRDTMSQLRLGWTTAKEWAAPAVLKHVDFSKGLGPLLDKIDKKWSEAADLDPVPEATAASLAKSIAEAQAVIVKYQKQIADGNKKLPVFGMTWNALEKQLRKLDEAMVQDAKDIGVACRELPDETWAAKGAYDRSGGKESVKAPRNLESDFQDYCRLARKIEGKAGDIAAAAKAAADGCKTCFGHDINLGKKMHQAIGTLQTCVATVLRKIADKQKDAVTREMRGVEEVAAALFADLPDEGVELRAAMTEHIIEPLRKQAQKATA